MYKIHHNGSMSSTLFSMDLELLKRKVEAHADLSFFEKVLNCTQVEAKWEQYKNKWRYYCYYYNSCHKDKKGRMCLETIIKLE